MSPPMNAWNAIERGEYVCLWMLDFEWKGNENAQRGIIPIYTERSSMPAGLKPYLTLLRSMTTLTSGF